MITSSKTRAEKRRPSTSMEAPDTNTRGWAGRTIRLRTALRDFAASVCLVAGGVLWALSPLGIHLSDLRLKSPDLFWKLFPSAPLFLGLGLLVLYLGRGGFGRLVKLGLGVALIGALLVLVGDIGLFYLHLDDRYIATAPAWRALRLGLVLLCAGSTLFGVAAARGGTSDPVWGALPFAMTSLGGLIAVLGDQGSFGATLWVAFGFGWAWLGLSHFMQYFLGFRRARANKHGHSGLSEDSA